MKRKMVKILLVFSVIILVSAGCNKKQESSNPQILETKKEVQETESAPEAKPIGQAQNKENAGEVDYKLQTETAPILTVDQKVEGSADYIQYTYKENQTAYDVLTATHKVEARDYGAMGQFVQSIDGVKADSGHFWEFWVNGKSSNVGASSYKLQNGDKLEWKLTVIK